jgi:hypothetical protein
MPKPCCGAQNERLTALPRENIARLHAAAGQGTIAKPLGRPTESGHRFAATLYRKK